MHKMTKINGNSRTTIESTVGRPFAAICLRVIKP